jgi:hypothetical protein
LLSGEFRGDGRRSRLDRGSVAHAYKAEDTDVAFGDPKDVVLQMCSCGACR